MFFLHPYGISRATAPARQLQKGSAQVPFPPSRFSSPLPTPKGAQAHNTGHWNRSLWDINKVSPLHFGLSKSQWHFRSRSLYAFPVFHFNCNCAYSFSDSLTECLWYLYCVSHTVNRDGHRSHLHVHDGHLPYKEKTGEKVQLPRFTNTHRIASWAQQEGRSHLPPLAAGRESPAIRKRQDSRGFPRCAQGHTTLKGNASQTRSQRSTSPTVFKCLVLFTWIVRLFT